jgi:hypothetical protein
VVVKQAPHGFLRGLDTWKVGWEGRKETEGRKEGRKEGRMEGRKKTGGRKDGN